MYRTSSRRRPALLAGIMLFACATQPAPAARARGATNGQPAVTQATEATDAQLIERLASPDHRTADAAAAAILSRGERMIPLLMKLRGDRRPFSGGLTSSPSSSAFVFVPDGGEKKALEEGRRVTVEVSALFLITAIYHGTLSIAQSPFLTDLKLPEVRRRSVNSKRLVERAWNSTADWQRRLEASGLAKLKAENDYPLKAASVRFW